MNHEEKLNSLIDHELASVSLAKGYTPFFNAVMSAEMLYLLELKDYEK